VGEPLSFVRTFEHDELTFGANSSLVLVGGEELKP